jgi:hypothetical protein
MYVQQAIRGPCRTASETDKVELAHFLANNADLTANMA